MVIIWFGVPGYSTVARWERRRDFPDEGGDVSSVGTRRESKVAIERNAPMAVGVEMRGVTVSEGPGARRSRTP